MNPLKSGLSTGFVEDVGDKGVPAGDGGADVDGDPAADGFVAEDGVVAADGAVAADGVPAADGVVASEGAVAAWGVVWASSKKWDPALLSAGCESNEKAAFEVIARTMHTSEQKMMRRLISPPLFLNER